MPARWDLSSQRFFAANQSHLLPSPEVAAAGHDRCIVPIKPENVDPWLNPDASNLAALHAILDDRDRPYYEHQKAA
jgi:putative SOS response-associated peptidase YedK